MQTQEAFNFDPELPINERNLRVKAEAWIEKHPHVYRLFEQYALEMGQRNRRFGMKALVERVRWQVRFDYQDEEFKLNNSYTSYFARKLVEKHPQLKGLIEMRKVRY